MTKIDRQSAILPFHGKPQVEKKEMRPSGSRKGSSKFGTVIREYRMKAGLEQQQVSAALGLSKNAVSNWENGITRPDVDTIAGLCSFLNIPLNVFFGVSNSGDLADEQDVMRLYRSLNKYNRATARQVLLSLANNERRADFAQRRDGYRKLPEPALASSAGTGEPLDGMCEPAYTYVLASHLADEADEIIRVNGDSMEPTIANGSRVFVKNATSIDAGQIGIFIINGEAYIKEFQRDGLHSHNSKYAVIHPSDYDDAHCVGLVLGIVDATDIVTDNKEISLLDEAFEEDDDE